MVLVVACQLTIDMVTRTATAGTVSRCGVFRERTATLYHKVWQNPVKGQSVIKAVFGQFFKVRYRVRCVLVIELDGHVAFCSLYYCFTHFCFFRGSKVSIMT